MLAPTMVLYGVILGQTSGHDANAVFQALRAGGVAIGGKSIAFPAPLLRDGQTADDERAALRAVAGPGHAVDELLRDSVTAPFVLKLRDETSTHGDPIRLADLWFAIHADLDAIDPSDVARLGEADKPIEAGNMRFVTRLLDDRELAARGIAPADRGPTLREWFTHSSGRLLDRIQVEVTGRSIASRSAGAWVVASRTDPRFDADGADANRWWPIERRAGRDEIGRAHPYSGAASYVKISRLTSAPGALLVEVHLAFEEPRAWFDGAPVLRSKISVIAQDQVRRLRRELARWRAPRRERGARDPVPGRPRAPLAPRP
ncbi:MAG: hypothetical protein JO116_22160 [Planctomycetaceae bacterium]|nr:hypothetical protein [Planctomycetaceae bacterium]